MPVLPKIGPEVVPTGLIQKAIENSLLFKTEAV
jgi:hypothetical protein